MRVGLVTHRFPPEGRGGTETHVALSARSLAQLGHEVEVLAGRPGEAHRVHDGEGIRRLETPLTEEYALARPDPWVRREFERWLDETAPDVVHVHHLLFLAPDLVVSARERGVPVVVTLHDLWFQCALVHAGAAHSRAAWGLACFLHAELMPPRKVLSLVRRRRLRSRLVAHVERPRRLRDQLACAGRVLAPSHFIAARYAAFGVPRVDVLPHPVAVPWRPPRRPATPVRFGYVGALVAHKGVDVLLEAASRAGIEPRLVGSAVDGVPEGARWLGEVGHADIGDALGAIDVLVVPSLVPESFSLVAHEAQALGIPVVASRIGALPELVQDGVNGLLVPPGDVGALARALRRLSSPDEVRRLQDAARAPLAPRDHARRLELVYAEVTRSRATAPGRRSRASSRPRLPR